MLSEEGSIFHTNVPRPTRTRNHLALVAGMFVVALAMAVGYAEFQGENTPVVMTKKDEAAFSK